MHELAITESVVAGVLEHVDGARVVRVVLEIGKLSGVSPDAIRFCFDVCAQGTTLEGATLEILEPAGRGHCPRCKSEFELQNLLALCACGSAELNFLAGQELLVKAVEVA